MPEFFYEDMLPLQSDPTEYRLLTKEGVELSLIHISEPTRPSHISRMPSSA